MLFTEGVSLFAFPWGRELGPYKGDWGGLRVAVVHEMVWEGKRPYPGAPDGGNVREIRKRLRGYDVGIFGDNHEGFVSESKKGATILNCGSLMRRTACQEYYTPKCYLLFNNGSVGVHPLDTFMDIFSREHVDAEKERDDRIASFVSGLREDIDIDLSFETNLERYCEANDVPEEVRKMIREEMG